MRPFWAPSRLTMPQAQEPQWKFISKVFSTISPSLRTSIRSFSTREASKGIRSHKKPRSGYRIGRRQNDNTLGRSILMKRRDFMKLSAGFGALATLTPLSPARAQAKMVFKASDVQPPGYPTVVATENLGKKLEAATNGRLSVQMYPSMQLGGEKETIEQAQVGAIAFARVSVGALGPVVDDLNVFNLPYVFRNTSHMQHVIDGPIGQELLDKVTNS